MKKYGEGTVCFDNLVVLGKEFTSDPNPLSTSYWDYCFSVACVINGLKRRKKGDPEQYIYEWGGHLNIGVGNVKIHLHNIDGDVGLVKQEAKLQLLHDTLKEVVKLYKTWGKEPRKPVSVRHWLNPADSRYTGMVAYSMAADGTGTVSLGDCHKTIVIWLPFPSGNSKDGYSAKIIKQVEDIAKGAAKAIGGIQQLRKFFEREVFDVSEK